MELQKYSSTHTPPRCYMLFYTWGKYPITHCTGGWVSLGASLDRYRKSRSHWGSNPEPSSVAILLSYPGHQLMLANNITVTYLCFHLVCRCSLPSIDQILQQLMCTETNPCFRHSRHLHTKLEDKVYYF